LRQRIRGRIPIPGKRVALGDAFFQKDGSHGAPFAPDHECGQVAIAVECESRTGNPLMPNGPEHANAVYLIERVGSVNEKKPPFFFRLASGPELGDGMDAAFDAGFKSSTKLVDAALLLGIAATCKKNKFGTKAAPSFTNSKRADAWALVECNQTSSHERSVSSPWREGIG
jgi:hypothetical protein